MSSTTGTSRARRRKRPVTRRVRDEKGNIIVKRYAKKQSRFKIPGLTWRRVPSLAIGLPLMLQALGTYAFNKGYLAEGSGLYNWFSSFNEYTGVTKLLVTGTLGTVIPLILAYPLVTKGFKIRRYGAAWRELVAIWMIAIVAMSIFSPFFNYTGSQQPDSQFVTNTDNYNLSGLNSPFYAELLNGLLNLLGNIPNPEEQVAYVHPADGGTFNPGSDRYLYRWRIAETYDNQLKDFKQGFTDFQNTNVPDFTNTYNTQYSGNLTNARHLQISEQYLTVATDYKGEVIAPWNSVLGTQIGSPSAVTAEAINNTDVSIVQGSQSAFKDINEQPYLKATLSAARTQGYLTYDSYFVQDDKAAIKNQAYLYANLNNALTSYLTATNADRFANIATEGSIGSIWGEQSLPGGAAYKDQNTNFLAKYNQFNNAINSSSTTVYDLALNINNEIQSAILDAIAKNTLSIDPTGAGAGTAPDGVDKAYYFYDALANGQPFGMKEAIAGLVNMLRAFNIPARPVLGFSVGDFQNADGSSCTANCDQILIKMGHVHVWVEALIPRLVNGQLTFSWGAFNPIPDPYILQNDPKDFEFGRNSLGGAPDVQLEVTSGIGVNFTQSWDFGPLGTKSGVLSNQVGTDVTGRVRVLYEGEATSGANVNIRLVNESEILDQTLDVNLGAQIATVNTVDTGDGWTNFKFFVATNGSVYKYEGTDLIYINRTVGLLNPLGSPHSLGVYGLVGSYGLSFGGDITGFSLNATLTIDANTSRQTVINPNTLDTVDAFGILKNSVINFTVTVTQPGSGDPVSGIDGIKLLMLSEAQATTLAAQLQASNYDTTFIDSNSFAGGSDVSTTDANGNGTLLVDFSQESFATSQVYALVAVLQTGFLFGSTVAWYSSDLTLASTLKYANGTDVQDDTLTYENGMFNSNTIDFILNSSVTGLGSAVNPQFTSVPAGNVQLTYYILEESVYNTYVFGFTGLVAYTNLASVNFLNNAGSCGIDAASFSSSGCYDVQFGSLTTAINFTGGTSTDNTGFAQVLIHLENSGFATGYFYIIVVANDFSTLADTVRFISTSPPALALLSLGTSGILQSSPGTSLPTSGLLGPNVINTNYMTTYQGDDL